MARSVLSKRIILRGLICCVILTGLALFSVTMKIMLMVVSFMWLICSSMVKEAHSQLGYCLGRAGYGQDGVWSFSVFVHILCSYRTYGIMKCSCVSPFD